MWCERRRYEERSKAFFLLLFDWFFFVLYVWEGKERSRFFFFFLPYRKIFTEKGIWLSRLTFFAMPSGVGREKIFLKISLVVKRKWSESHEKLQKACQKVEKARKIGTSRHGRYAQTFHFQRTSFVDLWGRGDCEEERENLFNIFFTVVFLVV